MLRKKRSSIWCAIAACAASCHEDSDAASPQPQDAIQEPTAAASSPWPPFSIRGRWEDPRTLRYRIEATPGPMSPRSFAEAIERAIAQWNATGCVSLAPTADAGADIMFGWRSGAHDRCEPFDRTSALAHAGPVGCATFVHFDASRAFLPNGSGPLSMQSVALHEIGHVLGLDHVEGRKSAMSTDPARTCAVGEGDQAGLHSLYGGATDDESDLRIVGIDGTTRATLRRIAPREQSEFGWIDADGNGSDELMVWRTDTSGHGALMVYHFGQGPRLVRTAGPFLGVVVAGARTQLVVTDHGERLIVSEMPNQRRTALSFSDLGALEPFGGEPPPLPTSSTTKPDFDGDGSFEAVVRTSR